MTGPNSHPTRPRAYPARRHHVLLALALVAVAGAGDPAPDRDTDGAGQAGRYWSAPPAAVSPQEVPW